MIRHRRARKDAKLSSIVGSIAQTFDLPRQSIKLVLPSGRKARSTAGIASFRKAWRKYT